MISTAETRREGDTDPTCSVLLAATQRVGSTVLCDLMTTSDCLGYPKEFFLDDARQAFLDGWDLPADTDDATFLQHALRNGTSPNGVFAVKVMADQLDALDRVTQGEGLGAFPEPVVVWLQRRDLLAAAVSQWRAEQTGRWSSAEDGATDGADGDLADVPPNDDTALARIDQLHALKHEHDEVWAARLAACGRPVLRTDYEDWSQDPQALLAMLAAVLGVALDGARPHTNLQPQRDALNDEAARRWWAQGGCDTCPTPR